jgi:hypothetical protein
VLETKKLRQGHLRTCAKTGSFQAYLLKNAVLENCQLRRTKPRSKLNQTLYEPQINPLFYGCHRRRLYLFLDARLLLGVDPSEGPPTP